MKSIFKLAGFLILPALTMTGCGSLNLGQAVQVKLDPTTQTAKLEVELSDGLQVSLNGEFKIPNAYGTIYFVQPTKTTNAKIGIEVSMAAIIGQQINLTTVDKLPNGAPFPVAITPPLFLIPVFHDSSFDMKALLSLTPELQLGAEVGIKAFSSTYVVPGAAICQNFRNANKVAFAAVCIYGPTADNSQSGGIMIGGTFGNVIPSDWGGTISMASSSTFKMASSSQALNFDAVNLTSNSFDQAIYDPNSELTTSKGQKSLKNVMKVLKVR